MHNFKITEAKC